MGIIYDRVRSIETKDWNGQLEIAHDKFSCFIGNSRDSIETWM